MKHRLQTLLASEKMPSSKFAELIGVNRSSISHLLSGRNNPSLDVLQKVLLSFPHINPDWLLLGQGNMYRNKKDSKVYVPTSNVLPFEDEKPASTVPNTSKIETNEQIKPDIQEPEDSPVYQVKSKTDLSAPKPIEDMRKLDKIVFFYTDHSFETYHPNH